MDTQGIFVVSVMVDTPEQIFYEGAAAFGYGEILQLWKFSCRKQAIWQRSQDLGFKFFQLFLASKRSGLFTFRKL